MATTVSRHEQPNGAAARANTEHSETIDLLAVIPPSSINTSVADRGNRIRNDLRIAQQPFAGSFDQNANVRKCDQ
jgi:hypothetical protein